MWRLVVNPRTWLAVVVVAGLAAIALWPRPLPVDVGPVTMAPLVVTIDEEGETRVREKFVVSAPLAGRVLRIEVEPGDRVTAGQVLTRVRPEAPPLLDARTAAEARATANAANAALGQAKAREQQAQDALAHASREFERTRSLIDAGLATRQELDARDADRRSAVDGADAAAHAVEVAAFEVRRAAARISTPGPIRGGSVAVTSPIAGVVLRRLRESESLVPGGEPLLEVGDPGGLEIVADLLSTDAVQIRPHARVLVEGWGGDHPLEARVRRIEPSGFTKVSALGVDEQRVNIVCDLVDPGQAWERLGDAYRVEVRVVVWEAARTLTVPTSALFRTGSDWAVYLARDGRARRTAVRIGHRTPQSAEVLEGLREGDVVVLYPGEALADGSRVTVHTP